MCLQYLVSPKPFVKRKKIVHLLSVASVSGNEWTEWMLDILNSRKIASNHLKREWKRVKEGTKSKNSGQEFDQYLNGLINHDYEETNSREIINESKCSLRNSEIKTSQKMARPLLGLGYKSFKYLIC